MSPKVHNENERTSSELSDTVIQSEVKKNWTSYVWDTLDKSPEERRLLFKLDTALLTFASLGQSTRHVQIFKTLDEDEGKEL
jgi:hypothetical protein